MWMTVAGGDATEREEVARQQAESGGAQAEVGGEQVQAGREEPEAGREPADLGGAEEAAGAGDASAAGRGDEPSAAGSEVQAGAEPAEADETAALRRRVEELEALNRELNDQFLRLAADFDNFRRRVRQNEEAVRAAAAEALMKDLLPILDHLEMAVAAAGDLLETPFGQGVSLIRQQLLDVLARHGLEPLAAQGKPFDPQTMEAVAVDAATDNVPAGHVSAELRRGYKLNGKLLRPSLVKVAQSS